MESPINLIKAPYRSTGETSSAQNRTATHCQEYTSNPTLKTFTCFSELAIELRLEIWRGAFRDPTKIDLRPSKIPEDWQNSSSPSLPVTLSVNRESREETRRYYDVFFLPTNVSGQKPAPPLCFAPTIDSFYFCCSTTFPKWDSTGENTGQVDERHDWVPIILGQNPHFLDAIEDVVIDMPHVHEHTLSLTILLSFPRLKHVCMTIEHDLWEVMHYYAVTKDVPEHMRFFERVRQGIANYLEKHKDSFTGDSVPEVVCPALHSCESESCEHLSMLRTTSNP